MTGIACLTFLGLGFRLLLLPPDRALVGGDSLVGVACALVPDDESPHAFPRCRLFKIVDAVRKVVAAAVEGGGSGVEEAGFLVVVVRVDLRASRVLIRGESRPLQCSPCSGLSSADFLQSLPTSR